MSRKRRKLRPGVINDRIMLMCSTVNRIANELDCLKLSTCEFAWALHPALEREGVPESWIEAAMQQEVLVDFQTSYRVNGYCISPEQLRRMTSVLLELEE